MENLSREELQQKFDELKKMQNDIQSFLNKKSTDKIMCEDSQEVFQTKPQAQKNLTYIPQERVQYQKLYQQNQEKKSLSISPRSNLRKQSQQNFQENQEDQFNDQKISYNNNQQQNNQQRYRNNDSNNYRNQGYRNNKFQQNPQNQQNKFNNQRYNRYNSTQHNNKIQTEGEQLNNFHQQNQQQNGKYQKKQFYQHIQVSQENQQKQQAELEEGERILNEQEKIEYQASQAINRQRRTRNQYNKFYKNNNQEEQDVVQNDEDNDDEDDEENVSEQEFNGNKFKNQKNRRYKQDQQNQENQYQLMANLPSETPISKDLKQQATHQHFDGRKYTILMVSEKPSIARAIAEALAGEHGYTTRKGICKYCNVYEFTGHIFNKNALFKVTSVIGHIYTTDFPPDYQDWRKIDPVKLFDAPTIKKETNPDSQIIQHLQQESLGSSYLILWLDNDKEGENICFEVLQTCRPNLMKEEFQQVFRAKFSSVTNQDINLAFNTLSVGPNQNESIAVDARQIIDLKVGVSFSRFQTRYLVRKYQELNQKKITFGPCQTPTLHFCVDRDDTIRNFKSQEFYKPILKAINNNPSNVNNQAGYNKINNKNNEIQLDWVRERTFIQDEALIVKQTVEQTGSCIVVDVENKDRTRQKPEALNTVSLLRLASQQIGLGPQSAMQVAERLYLGGYITYPRTESTSYSQSFDFLGVVQALSRYGSCIGVQSYAGKLLQFGMDKPRQGQDAGDHPPITPTNKTPQYLHKDEANMFEMISRYFLASISQDARFFKKKVVFNAGDQIQAGNNSDMMKFSIQGTACVNPGFLEVLPWIKIRELNIPNYKLGDILQVSSVDVHVGKTQPPEYLSESDLISLMEQNGIGTDASMAQHINNICEREYVTVLGQSRRLIPTELGRALVHSYKAIDNELVVPELRSSIEKSVDCIAKGELQFEEVLKNVIDLFKKKYIYFVSNVQKMDSFFNITFSTLENAILSAPEFSRCGRCKQPTRLLEPVNKLYCIRCKFMYGLPRYSTYETADDCLCPVDGFQLIICNITCKGNTKRQTICPLCFQKSPSIEEISLDKYERMSCSLCINNLCQFSMLYNQISNCKHCDKNGKLIIDWPNKGRYTMTCNVCFYQYIICEDGNVLRSNSKCSTCQSFLVKIKFNKPIANFNGLEFQGCLFCAPEFQDLLIKKPPNETQQPTLSKVNRFMYTQQENNNKLEIEVDQIGQDQLQNNQKQQYQKREQKRSYNGRFNEKSQQESIEKNEFNQTNRYQKVRKTYNQYNKKQQEKENEDFINKQSQFHNVDQSKKHYTNKFDQFKGKMSQRRLNVSDPTKILKKPIQKMIR